MPVISSRPSWSITEGEDGRTSAYICIFMISWYALDHLIAHLQEQLERQFRLLRGQNRGVQLFVFAARGISDRGRSAVAPCDSTCRWRRRAHPEMRRRMASRRPDGVELG